MKLLRSPAVMAFSATTLVLQAELQLLMSVLSGAYHDWGPISSALAPVLIDFALHWVVLWLLFRWAARTRGPEFVYPALGVVLIRAVVQEYYKIRHLGPVPGVVTAATALILIAWICWMLTAKRRDSTPPEWVTSLGTTVVFFAAIVGVLQMTTILAYGWEARGLNDPRPLHQAVTGRVPRPRVLWVVLDELSYQQVYDHRIAQLRLPAFDQLAQESTVMTHTVPAANYTDLALPSLITGRAMKQVNSSPAGVPLRFKDSSSDAWQVLNPHDTVFQDALNTGYSTTVAGWYIPYCRLLSEVLDRCFWTARFLSNDQMTAGGGILSNTRQLMRQHAVALLNHLHLGARQEPYSLEGHQADYTSLVDAGDKLLRDPSADFVLLHMPIPHPEGIYRRDTARLSDVPTTYIDNLALADSYLAHLRQELEQNGTWDDTTLVLMGDHSWRTWMWSADSLWTPEEQADSGGAVFDDRPLYLVKLPHQSSPQRIDAPFAAVRTRSLLDALMAGQIKTPQQLADWAAR